MVVARAAARHASGIDPISGSPRFTFGVLQLQDGFDFVPLAMGLFGIVRDLHQPRDER